MVISQKFWNYSERQFSGFSLIVISFNNIEWNEKEWKIILEVTEGAFSIVLVYENGWQWFNVHEFDNMEYSYEHNLP